MGREGHHAKIFRQTFISHSNFAHLKPLNKKYITFSPEAVIPIDSLRWIKGRPSNNQKNIMDAGNYITVQPLKP